MIQQKRTAQSPHLTCHAPCPTHRKIGRNDVTAIWFHQHVEQRHHFIYYMQNRLEDLSFYVRQLWDLRDIYKWYYGTHYLPHDVGVTDISERQKRTRLEVLQDAGLRPTAVVPKIRLLNDGISMVRDIFDQCYFDSEGCEEGLQMLGGYEWSYDEMNKVTRDTPARNVAKNGADAFRQFAQGYRPSGSRWGTQAASAGHGGRAGRKYAARRSAQGTPLNPSYDHVL